MFFKRWRKPKSAAYRANEAEIEKLSEEATRGELGDEFEAPGGANMRGFFDSPGVRLPDDKPYDGPPAVDGKI